MENFSLTFDLSEWFYWGDVYSSNDVCLKADMVSYSLSDIPLVKRRRLPEVARRVHESAKKLADENVPIIYASTNGELSQTLSIIRSFPTDVSPAKFSLSVHNAVAGLLAVIHGNTQNYQSVDSLSGIIETAVVEAVGLLAEHQKVGVIYYDESFSREFLPDTASNPPPLQVLFFTICRGDDYRLEKRKVMGEKPCDYLTNDMASVKNIADFLRGAEISFYQSYANSAWEWRRSVS